VIFEKGQTISAAVEAARCADVAIIIASYRPYEEGEKIPSRARAVIAVQ
jgi:hypothetical protein